MKNANFDHALTGICLKGRLLCALLLLVLGIGCGRKPEPKIPKPHPMPASIEEAKAQHTLRVKPGDYAGQVLAICGTPKSDVYLKRFDPPVMRELAYADGLTLIFNKDLLCSICVASPSEEDVCGVRVGDPISRVQQIYGTETTVGPTNLFTFENSRMHQWKDLPEWTVYETNGIVVGLDLRDQKLWGDWQFSGFK